MIDDFLLRPLSPDQAADTLEVIEDRSGLRSTILTSQLPVAMWHEALGEPTLADAVLDRVLQGAQRIELEGESMPGRAPAATAPSADDRLQLNCGHTRDGAVSVSVDRSGSVRYNYRGGDPRGISQLAQPLRGFSATGCTRTPN